MQVTAMETIRIETKKDMAFITLDRPKQRNAINEQMLYELQEVCREIDGKKGVRCVVITGSEDGKAFAAGADIAAMESMSYKQAKDFAYLGCETMRMIERLKQPVIAAVNGYAQFQQ